LVGRSTGVGGVGFVEDGRVEDRDGVEAWAASVVGADAEEVLGYEVDACGGAGCEGLLQVGDACFNDVLRDGLSIECCYSKQGAD
jgi:hypothetical protein